MSFGLIKEVRDVNRLNHIILILVESGFSYLISKIRLGHVVPLKKRIKARLRKDKIKPEVRVRLILEKLGPTFIKFGQLLSVRPDLIPKQYVKELEKLQDDVEPFPYEKAKSIVEKELEKPINKLFLSFSKKPIASASVSQVHKAVLKNKKSVAVKVQRPKIREIMETDIDIMFYIANLIQKYIPEIEKYKPVSIVKEFADWTKKESDFKIEAKNAHRFYQNFKGSKTVHIPKVYDSHTTSKVLTLEYINAYDIRNIQEIRKKRLNIDKIIKNGFDAVLTMVFVHGFFHADPHPGNILVLKNNKISFVDFGIVGRFDEDLKRKSIDLCYGIIEKDADKIVDVLLDLGTVKKDSINKAEFKKRIEEVIEPLQYSRLKDVKLSAILEDVLDIALEYDVKMPIDFILFGKTIVTLEGIALEYDPNFKVIDNIKPLIEELIKRKFNPKKVMSDFMKSAVKFKRFLDILPDETEAVLKKIKEGSIKIDVEDTDIKKLSLEIDRSSNRIAYGMIIASLLIASALTIQVKGPVFFGLPIISFIAFVCAIILILILFVSILRTKR
jgi:ubiquinone biosynthesis protein